MFGGKGMKPWRSRGRCVGMAADGGGYVRLSAAEASEGLEAERGIFLNRVEARALLYPLPGLDDAVSVQVGAEVTVSANRALRVDVEQHADEEA